MSVVPTDLSQIQAQTVLKKLLLDNVNLSLIYIFLPLNFFLFQVFLYSRGVEGKLACSFLSFVIIFSNYNETELSCSIEGFWVHWLIASPAIRMTSVPSVRCSSDTWGAPYMYSTRGSCLGITHQAFCQGFDFSIYWRKLHTTLFPDTSADSV